MMDFSVVALLQGSDVLLLFTVLGFGLLLGRVSLGSFELGTTTGVLLVALLFGNWGLDFSAQTESLGFMLFIFCIGIEAGPNFFSTFAQDGVRYIVIALVVAATGVLVAVGIAKALDLDAGLAAGMLAGSLTSTPTLVGAQDAATQQAAMLSSSERVSLISQISVGYAMTYVVGMVGLLLTLRYLPRLFNIDLPAEAKKIASARGLGNDQRRTIRTPILRAYLVTETAAEQIAGRSLRELRWHERFGLLVERIIRDGKIIAPDPETVIALGDRVALVGFPNSHARSELRVAEQVYDPDLLEFQMGSEDVVVSKATAVGKTLGDLRLESEYSCFADGVSRAQVEVPLDRDMILNRGDVLTVSGERQRLRDFAEKIGFINQKSDVSDLMSFSFFFVLGLVIAQFSLVVADMRITLGSAGGLLASGILMGYFRARNPTFGHVPQGAINILKDLGLNLFMVGVGLSAGSGIVSALVENGLVILLSALMIMLVPAVVGYCVGHFVLKMNPALLLGAIAGAMTSTPGLKSVNELANSNIPSLGYAGTYTFSNVFLTLGGAAMVAM
jgi:putative transport protein